MAEHDQPERRPSEPSAPDSSSQPSQPSQPSPMEPSSIDPEQLRQFQQFQEFQEFQRFQQEAQRRQATKPPPARDWRSFLRWLITRRLVRRLLRLAIIIVIVLFALRLAIDHYFGSSNSSPNTQGQASRRSQDPKDAVRGIYAAVKDGQTSGCLLFTPDARSAFARDMGADTCEHAVEQAARKVWDKSSYIPDKIPDVAGSGEVTISSCTLPIQGGERLGKFVLTKESDAGWIISGHQKEDCPTG